MSFREVMAVFKVLLPFLFSHHPICSFFSHDTYTIFGRRFCLGCSITYPLAIITVLILSMTGAHKNLPEPIFHQSILLLSSIIMGSIQGLKYGSTTEGRTYRIIVKVLLGLAIGGVVFWTLTLPIIWPFRIGLLFGAIVSIMFLGTFRILYMRRICAGCIYHGDWDICYGFRGINRYHAFRDITSTRKLSNLIFDRDRKKKAPHGTGPSAFEDDREPPLKDDIRWLYHDGKGDIAWLPKTGLEVSSVYQLSDHKRRKKQ